MSKYNLVDIAEGMGYKEYEDAKEADRLEAHPESAKIKAAQAMMAKEKAGIKEDEEYSNHRDKLRKIMRLVFDIVRKYDLDAEDVMDELGEEFNVPFEFGRAGGIEENIIKEEEGFVEVSKDEIKMHLDQYRDGNIDGDDLANAVEEIVFSRMEESFIGDKSNKDLTKMGTADMNLWHVQKLLDAGILQDSEKTKALLVLDPTNPWGMEESFKTDGESEDSVDNIDKVASPSAKGRGYGAAVGAERSEDDKEQSDITQTTKPMYTENGHVEDYKDEIKEGAYKDFIGQAKEAYSMSEVEDYMESVNNDMRLNGDESYDDWTVEDYMEDLRNYIDEKMDDVREHFNRFK